MPPSKFFLPFFSPVAYFGCKPIKLLNIVRWKDLLYMRCESEEALLVPHLFGEMSHASGRQATRTALCSRVWLSTGKYLENSEGKILFLQTCKLGLFNFKDRICLLGIRDI